MANKIECFYLVSEVVSGSFITEFFFGTIEEAASAANKIRVAKGFKTKSMLPCEYHYWKGN